MEESAITKKHRARSDAGFTVVSRAHYGRIWRVNEHGNACEPARLPARCPLVRRARMTLGGHDINNADPLPGSRTLAHMREQAGTPQERVPACPSGRCGARTQAGAPCRSRCVPGRKRCRWHGGCSTGPRTPEGKRKVMLNLPNTWRPPTRAPAQ